MKIMSNKKNVTIRLTSEEVIAIDAAAIESNNNRSEFFGMVVSDFMTRQKGAASGGTVDLDPVLKLLREQNQKLKETVGAINAANDRIGDLEGKLDAVIKAGGRHV
jgi:uncharacterized protein (DUF1778 family)